MKQRFKRIQIPLVIVISLFFVALPAYPHCTNFSGTKFTSSDLFFQNSDQENGLPDGGKGELKVFGPTGFLTLFLLGTHLSEECSHLFPEHFLSFRKSLFSVVEKTGLLRFFITLYFRCYALKNL
jgi:hypothetical protein